MKDDDQIFKECLDALIENVGLAEATRFITLIKQEPPFDYMKWREEFFKDKSIETIFREAAELSVRTKQAEKTKAEETEKRRKTSSRTPKATAPRPPKTPKNPAARRKPAKRPVHA